jgi:hypothetical protein
VTLDKSMPLTFILLLFVQIVGVSFFMSGMSSDILHNEKGNLRLADRVQQMEINTQSQAVTIARMDENIKSILKSLTR